MNIKFALLITVSSLLSGCATPRAPEMRYAIDIPREYQSEIHCWKSGGVAGCQRYMNGFEQGWWSCVEDYAADINHETTLQDYSANGWGQFISGVADGYKQADEQIQRNIRHFGKTETEAYLKDILLTLAQRMEMYDQQHTGGYSK